MPYIQSISLLDPGQGFWKILPELSNQLKTYIPVHSIKIHHSRPCSMSIYISSFKRSSTYHTAGSSSSLSCLSASPVSLSLFCFSFLLHFLFAFLLVTLPWLVASLLWLASPLFFLSPSTFSFCTFRFFGLHLFLFLGWPLFATLASFIPLSVSFLLLCLSRPNLPVQASTSLCRELGSILYKSVLLLLTLLIWL